MTIVALPGDRPRRGLNFPEGRARAGLAAKTAATACALACFALLGSATTALAPAQRRVPAHAGPPSAATARAGVAGGSAGAGLHHAQTPAHLPSALQAVIDRALVSQPVSTPAGVSLTWGRAGQVSFHLAQALTRSFSLRPVSLVGADAEAFSPGPFVFGAKGVTEALGHGADAWYKSSAKGFEQGFTVSRAPAGASRAFSILLAYGGGLRASSVTPRALVISGPAGPEMTYAGLRATDATGRALPVHLSLAGATVRLTVDASGAAYPVRVDPFVAPASVPTTTFTGTGTEDLGSAVAISADGQLALLGAPFAGPGGAAYLYSGTSGTWAAAPLATFTGAGGEDLGSSVALSADGRTVLLGAPVSGSPGAAYLYDEPASGWPAAPAPTATFTASGSGDLGYSVALSADGRAALLGDPIAGSGGAAYLYDEPASGWPAAPAPTATFTGAGGEELGHSVALSADGRTALLGDPALGSGGAAYLYDEPASGWPAAPAPAPTATFTGTGGGDLGWSVALSADGQVALLGDVLTGSNSGAADLYAESSGSWPATPTDRFAGSGSEQLGSSVALSADGRVALVGAPTAGGSPSYDPVSGYGVAFAYGPWPTGWSLGAPAAATFTGSGGDLGWSVALSADGREALVGAPFAGSDSGIAYLYDEPASGWAGTPSPTATFTGTGSEQLGYSVALSADGRVALVGAPSTSSNESAAYLYDEPASGWAGTPSPTATFTGTGSDYLGYSVALSADGRVALVGAPFGFAAYLYAEPGSGWAGEPSPTASFTSPANDYFGYSVALSADGQTALVGGPSTIGAASGSTSGAYLYAETSGTWPATPTATFTGSASSGLGTSVALSADGQTALVGAPYASSDNGAAYLYARPASGWPVAPAPTSTFTGTADLFGWSVALSADRETALVGAPYASSEKGASYLYQATGVVGAVVTGSQPYGSPSPTFTYTVDAPSGLVVSGSPVCTEVETATAISASLAPGSYTLDAGTCSGLGLSGPGSSGYFLSYGGSLVVSPAPLTITAADATMTEGSPVPPITPSYSGFVLGQGPSSLTTAPSCSTTATPASAPGGYPATCTGAVGANYSISYVAGTVTVRAPVGSPPVTVPGTGPTAAPRPEFPDASTSYPNGAIVSFGGTFYVFAGGRAFAVPTSTDLARLEAVDHAVPLKAPAGALAPTAAAMRAGTLVTTSSVDANPTIYVEGTDGRLHGFASLHQFFSGGFDPALVVSLAALGNAPVSATTVGPAGLTAFSTLSDGALVVSGHTWYVFAGGRAFGIPTPGQLLALRQTDTALPLVGTVTTALVSATPADGALLGVDGGEVYVSYQDQVFGFKTMPQLLADGYGGTAAVPVPGTGGLPVVFPYSGS